ncbi:hypothetical protein CR513_33947, partial [Mucuna pruriens]
MDYIEAYAPITIMEIIRLVKGSGHKVYKLRKVFYGLKQPIKLRIEEYMLTSINKDSQNVH